MDDRQDKRLDRIEDKVDAISNKLQDTNVILAAQHESLKQHMRRTQLLEEAVKPIERHVSRVEGALKLLGVLATIAAVVQLIRMVV